MSANGERTDPWGSFEPYAQLIRSLMPRAISVTVFDASGEMRWTSETTTGPDLANLVVDVLPSATAPNSGPGLLRALENSPPVYFCWLKDDRQSLIAIVAVVCRPSSTGEADPARSFALAYAFLRPALECVRRDLLARTLIDDLNRSVTSLDKDLELLLTDTVGSASAASDNADELKGIVQQAMDHLGCVIAALIVPDKGIVQMRTAPGQPSADNQLVARTHRQLLSVAQTRHEPVIINRFNGNGCTAVPYRILSCPLLQTGGKAIGVLALFREQNAAEFSPRDARIGDILARKAHGVIESNYDAMSGLYTRPAFEQRVRAVIAAQKKGAQWSALYIDTDQLHVVNDNFGMHVGDGVIRQLGELVRRRLVPGAFAARISGDRFVALLPSGVDDAAQFAESLRGGAEKLSGQQGEHRVQVSVSIGVAALDAAAELMHSLAAAETACKTAKDHGRNRVETYRTDDPSIVRRFADVSIAARLRAAINEDRLRLDAQLIAPFVNGTNVRPQYELLLRMIDEDGATLGPDRFLSAANRYQLMPVLDRWVVERAIALLAPHAALLSKRSVGFTINLSGQSLNDDTFADFLIEKLEHCGLEPSLFGFELTENATIASIGRAEALMRRLRRIGCGVALDNFGTGLSSLSYLRQLPVTAIKIDGSFVRDVLKDGRAESMVQAIAQLARSMSIATVAAYVETEELRHRVAALGVDYGQGFAIGRPAPLQEMLVELPLIAAAAPVPVTVEEPPLELQAAAAAAANLH